MEKKAKFSDLKGKILSAISVVDDEVIYFRTQDDEIYKMFHYQDCCETVVVEDVSGIPLTDLLGDPILIAEERVSENEEKDCRHHTWTFYELATVKGAVTIRWHGSSNGYYSESVAFKLLDDNS